MRIGRRDEIGIQSGVLNFAFPLVADKIVARRKWERDQSQDYRNAPKQDRLFSQRDVDRKIRNCGQIGRAAEKRGRDKLYRHRLKRPIIEQIERGKKDQLQHQRGSESNNRGVFHVRAESACIASTAWAGKTGGTTMPRPVIRCKPAR